MYNLRMLKKWLPGLAAILMGAVLLVAGNWKFPSSTFSVPVVLTSGEPALVTGSLPSRGWSGEPADLTMRFQFTSPIQENQAQIRAEVVMPDAAITPQGQTSLLMDPSEPVNLRWQITPNRKGDLEGTLWVNSSTNGVEPQAVLAKRFQIHSMMILGISAAWIRRIGWGLLIIGIFYVIAFSSRRSRSKI